MTDHTDIDAAIDEAEAQVRHEPGCFECDRWRAHADTLRTLAALIPEPPADDVRKALVKTLTGLTDLGWDIATAQGFDHLSEYFDAADRVMASPEWRNRHRGPITDDEREALAEVRHNATHFDSKMTEEGFDRAIGVIRHRGPITDAMVREAQVTYRDFPGDHIDRSSREWELARVRAALEAAEAAR